MNLIDTLMHVSHSFGIKKVKGNSYGVSEQPESHCALHHDLLGGNDDQEVKKGKKQPKLSIRSLARFSPLVSYQARPLAASVI